MFKSAELATFAKNEKAKYFEDMHTKEDIERMIAYARGEGREQGREDVARKMLGKGIEPALISDLTGLTAEAIQALR